MTRRRDLMCKDLFGCDHTPETPLVQNGMLVGWLCRCGQRVPGPEPRNDDENTKRAPDGGSDEA